jgi:signal peptide peptidase SppA
MKKTYAIASAFSEEFKKMEERQEEFLAVDAAGWDMGDDDNEPRPYEVVNGVATYQIKGKMLHESNLFTQIFGITTYEDIGNDFAAMAQDDEVEKILISMSTPGGSVAGISDLTDTWKQLDAVKQITVHTSGMIASAGLWLAVNSSGGIYASETAEAGSVGVLMSHVSQEQALAKAGIKVTEIKSSPLKAIGSPAKDLTQEEFDHLQKKVDETADLFRRQIYKTRPSVKEGAFTGEVFIASDALAMGLIDGVKTYSEVFTSAMGADEINTNPGGFEMKKKVTAEMYESAVASGADPGSLEIVSQDEFEALEPETAVEPEATEPEATEPDAVEPEATEVELLQASYDAIESELVTAQAALVSAEARVAALEKEVDAEPFRPFIVERLETMRMALGLAKVDMSEFPMESLAVEYKTIDTAFRKAYKTGGHNVEKKEEKKPVASNVTSLDEARLRSVGI